MPLPATAQPLNRQTFIPVLLGAFQSNAAVKALVFLPGVADDFYLIHRDQPLRLRADNLHEALTALTNTTRAQVTFQAPWLLVHLDRDRLAANVRVRHQATAARLSNSPPRRRIQFCDRGWPSIQPELSQALSLPLLPKPNAREAMHLTRVNLAGWGLTDAEVLQALALAGGTTVTIQRNRASVEPGSRLGRGP
jgi:hypothetical protein